MNYLMPLADSRIRLLIGGSCWLLFVLGSLPSPFDTEWAVSLLLLVPLVLAPLALDLAACSSDTGWRARLWHGIVFAQLPAALLLTLAYWLPRGIEAALLALPWWGLTALVALVGLLRLRERGMKPLAELCRDTGLVYLAVGGAWAVADRYGMRPLDFEAVIVLLTAIHFHYAGFVLPMVAGLALQCMPRSRIAFLGGIGAILGVPLVAVGITATQLRMGTLPEWGAASWLAVSATLVAAMHLRLAAQRRWPPLVRCLWAVCALALLASMVLAGMYGLRFYLPMEWLSIPWMRALHGTANAFGFALAALLGWRGAFIPAPAPGADRVR